MRAAVLIIGSLLWDNSDRAAWRKASLDVDRRLNVKASIRYGRRSKGRGGTFTMTLDTKAPSGTAVLVPCVSPIETIEHLVAEAEALWRAEQSTEGANSIGAAWGCVGL